MMLLPIPQQIAVGAPLRVLSERTLRIVGAFAGEIADAADDLCSRAFGIRIVVDEADAAVAITDDGPTAPAPGFDPRPPARRGLGEGYAIRAQGEGLAVSAASAEGAFRAVVTIAAAAEAGELPALHVDDEPQRSWRGLSLDVVRHPLGVDEVLRVIDLMALHRLNVLHLHLTDTQGWRFEVPGYPGIAGADGFTANDLRRLEHYASDRFVTIVPEVDIPGHVSQTLSDVVPVRTGGHPWFRYLDADDDGVEQLLTAAFGVLAECFASPVLHLGGDEAFGAPEEAYRRTVAAGARIVRALGRTPMGWQEAIRCGVLGEDDLVQLWIAERDRFDAEKVKAGAPAEMHEMIDRAGELFALSIDDPARIGSAGVPAIVSSSDPLYLDRRPSDVSLDPAQAATGNTSYPPTPTTSVLDWLPEDQPDIAAAGVRVAGVEAALWCETVESFDDVARLLLPRLALVAQQAWAPADRAEVIRAAAAHGEVWTRLGFADHYRSAEIHSGIPLNPNHSS